MTSTPTCSFWVTRMAHGGRLTWNRWAIQLRADEFWASDGESAGSVPTAQVNAVLAHTFEGFIPTEKQ